jgi:hypothetical protein
MNIKQLTSSCYKKLLWSSPIFLHTCYQSAYHHVAEDALTDALLLFDPFLKGTTLDRATSWGSGAWAVNNVSEDLPLALRLTSGPPMALVSRTGEH